jgi:4-hydroxy-2-oxoheptanedioate aldolase
MFTNKTKAKLRQGKAVWGVMVTFPAPTVLEMLGYLGFDWVLLDNEHGDVTVANVEHCVRACDVAGLTPIVRPIVGRPDIVSPFMDRGCQGAQAPHINNAEEARLFVDGVRYPPEGRRGFFRRTRSNNHGFGLATEDYLRKANEETLTVAMIEEVEGVKNVKAIAETPGLDVVFVGTGDLSMSLGHAGQQTHPKVLEAADACFKATLNAGKVCGVSCPENFTEYYLERGVRFYHSSMHYLIATTSEQYLKGVRASAQKHGAA